MKSCNSVFFRGRNIFPQFQYFLIISGHCFTDEDPSNPSWDEITVGFGVDNVSRIDDPKLNKFKIQKRTIDNVYFHDDYKYPRAYADVVLVHLKDPVVLTENVYPICIEDKEQPNPDTMKDETATIVGYGPDTKGKTVLTFAKKISATKN